MTFNRNQFFLLLLGIITIPFVAGKLLWLATSEKTTGVMWYTGHGNLGSVLGISTYPVIRFKAGADSLYFNSDINFDIRPGERLPIRYQKSDPADACADNFVCIWAKLLIYVMFPVLVLLIIYAIPERWDPIIPRGSKIRLGKKPFFQIIRNESV